MDWSVGSEKDSNQLPPSAAKGHWSALLSTAHLLDAAAEEWRPSIRLIRRVSSALGWKATCAVLGQELVAMTGAGQVTLYVAPDPRTELQTLPLVGEPLPYFQLPSAVGGISVDEGTVSTRLSLNPAIFLLLAKPVTEEAIKALSVLAPELGELLGARFQGVSIEDPASDLAPSGPSCDRISTFRRRLEAVTDEWKLSTQQLADIKEVELEAMRKHNRAALDAAWIEHDLQLEALQQLSHQRQNIWRELLREVNLRWTQVEERLPEWAQQNQQAADSVLERLMAIEELLAPLAAPETLTFEESAYVARNAA